MQERDRTASLRLGLCGRVTLTFGALALFLALLSQRLQGVEPGHVLRAMGEVGPLPWLGAVLATWISFRAVAGYDVALHRHLGTGLASRQAGRAGFAAIAVGQMVGLGVLSGALVRWRMLPELGFAGALRLSVAVALSFLAAWSLLTLTVLSLDPAAPLGWMGPAGVTAAVVALLVNLAWPRPWMPNLITLGRLLVLAAIDCLAAALALWLLVPGALDPAEFLPIFLLAYGAGLVSGAPAGLGAFEIVLLALVPGVEAPQLLAGIVAWRVVYYALPALIGAGVALLARFEPCSMPVPLPAPQIAEAGLAALGEFRPHPAGFLAARTRHGLVALSDVACPAHFAAAAADEGRWPVLYKAAPRAAARARKAGLVVHPLAREAWLHPPDFRLGLPARAGLRRKLRRAEAAGVRADWEPSPDWAALSRVNAGWVAAHEVERGFSMGRFAAGYLAGQRVFVARQSGQVVGFASFHDARIGGEPVWTLDLLRPAPQAPDGTAQALVMAALRLARAEGVARLSLAAVPLGAGPDDRGFAAWLCRRLAPEAAGLHRFKAGFAPRWQRLYIAGPSQAALALLGWEVWRRVCHPPPLAKLRPTARSLDQYEFASDRNPWQRKGERPT